MYLGIILFRLILVIILWASWICMSLSFLKWEGFSHYFFKLALCPLLSSSETPIMYCEVIRNIHIVLCSWFLTQSSYNSRNFLSDRSMWHRAFSFLEFPMWFFHSNEATLDGLQYKRWIPEKIIIVRSLDSASPLILWRGVSGRNRGNKQSRWHDEASIKILKVWSLGSFQVSEYIYMLREWHTPASWGQKLLLLGPF